MRQGKAAQKKVEMMKNNQPVPKWKKESHKNKQK